MGQTNQEDIEVLESRIRPNGNPDIKDSLFISAKVKPVATYNVKA